MDGNSSKDDDLVGRVRQPSESSDEKSGKKQKKTVDNLLTSWPFHVNPEEISDTQRVLNKMTMAHEIAVNEEFKLRQQMHSNNSLEKTVQDMLHKVFWDILFDELKQKPPNTTKAVSVFCNVKELLDSILSPRNMQYREELSENLDLELIQQEAEHGMLDFKEYASYIISFMAKTCAPVRDEQIRELSKLTDIATIYKRIVETLNDMRIDMINYEIDLIRPAMVSVEKEEFKNFTSKCNPPGEDGKLPLTRKWIKRNMDPNNRNLSKMDILYNAFKETLSDDFIDIPETMITHMIHFIEARNQSKRLSVLASIILVTMSTVSSALRDLTVFRKQLKDHLLVLIPKVIYDPEMKEPLENITEQIIKDSNDLLKTHGFDQLSKEVESLLAGQINELADSNHQIRKITLERIHEFLKKSITSTATLTVPSALTSIEDELLALAKQFKRDVLFNFAVFGEYYEEIYACLLSESKQGDTGLLPNEESVSNCK